MINDVDDMILDHVLIAVRDLDETRDFYSALGFQVITFQSDLTFLFQRFFNRYKIGLRSCQLIVFESPDPDLARLLRVVHLESLTGFSRSRSIALVSCGSSPFSH